MITNTFSLLKGIGPGIEKKLWRSGILTWEDFLSAPRIGFISPRRKALYDDGLEEASNRLEAGDAAYFGSRLKRADHWRLFETFSEDAVCLDIESNGLPASGGGIPTVVGLYGKEGFTALTRGKDLSAGALRERLLGKKCLVTFFGSVFDVPFLEATLPGFRLDMPHFDLCFASRSLGYKGGLKKLEPKMGITRAEETEGLDGYDAVLLWRRAERGDKRAMELLVKYNMEDTVNLMKIARTLYPRLRESTGIGELA